MRWLSCAVLVLMSCGAAKKCVTPCGMTIISETGNLVYTCEEYAVAEAAAANRLSPLPVCKYNSGSTAREMAGDYTYIPGVSASGAPIKDKIPASGWTECWMLRISFHTRDGAYLLEESAFIHELAHLAQDCNAPLPIDEGQDFHHANWERDWIYRNIRKAEQDVKNWRKSQ